MRRFLAGEDPLKELIIVPPHPPTDELSTGKPIAIDIGGGYFEVTETKIQTRKTCYWIASYPGDKVAVWKVTLDGQIMAFSTAKAPPDTPAPTPMDPSVKAAWDHWQAVQAGVIPPDDSDQPPPLDPGPFKAD